MNETIRIYPQNMWTSLLISNERLELTVRNYGVRFGEKKKSAFEKTIFPIEKDIGERVSEEIKDQKKPAFTGVLIFLYHFQ